MPRSATPLSTGPRKARSSKTARTATPRGASRTSRAGQALRGAKPVSRDAEATRRAILSAATEEFASRGLGGARVDRIAERAAINKRMLYYYFGKKEALFLAVLEKAYRDIRDAERLLELSHADPIEAIRKLVAFTWNYHLEHPEFLRLLNSENLHKAQHLKRSREIRAIHSPFVAMIDEVLERGRHAGVFRAGVDTVQLYISIASLSCFYLSNRFTLSTIFGRDLLAPREQAERLGHMTDLVLGYLIRN
jgi:AcrR family transcriptional regulator